MTHDPRISASPLPDEAAGLATLTFVAEHRGQLVLHCGAVAQGSRCCLVVGASGAGKSTLTLALAEQGLDYLTDETASLDPVSLTVTPHEKPLTFKATSHEQLARLRPPAARIDPESANWYVTPPGPPPSVSPTTLPALVVLPDRHDDSRTEAEAITPARAAFLVGEQSSALWSVSPRPLAPLLRLVLSVPVLRLAYADAFAAAPLVRERLLAAAAPDPSRLTAVSDQPQPAPAALTGPARAVGVDWEVLANEAVLFDGTHLHHLDAPAAAVWRRLDGGTDVAEVAASVALEFATTPDALLTDVEDLVRVLRSRGLVTTPDVG